MPSALRLDNFFTKKYRAAPKKESAAYLNKAKNQLVKTTKN